MSDPVNASRFHSIIENPGQASLKRLAWAYGCAPRGSEEELRLLEILVARLLEVYPTGQVRP